MKNYGRIGRGMSVAVALVVAALSSVGDPAAAAAGDPSSLLKLANGDIEEFEIPTPDSAALDLVVGSDGNLWFTQEDGNKIGRITPEGAITEFTLPVPDAEPFGITSGSDGNLWFTTNGDWPSNGIGRITPAGDIDLYPLPASRRYSIMGDIVVGPDGGLWWGEGNDPRIGRATTQGVIDNSDFGDLSGKFKWIPAIAAASDGSVWWVDPFDDQIGRITRAGTVSEFPLPDGASPRDIVFGPDGNVWFTMGGASQEEGFVGQMAPSGELSEKFAVRDDFIPQAIALGPDENLWITGRLHRARSQLLRMTPDGTTTYFELPFELGSTDLFFPDEMVAGPDGHLWSVDSRRNKILRIEVAPRSIAYVALGDSIAAGEGGVHYSDYEDLCWRNANAYPRIFGRLTGIPVEHVGCSSAKIDNIFLTDQRREHPDSGETATMPPQVEQIPAGTELITLTVGANDIGWAKVIASCAGLETQGSCRDADKWDDLEQRILDQGPRLKKLLVRLDDLEAAKDAQILVVGYPHFFPRPRDNTWWESNARCGKFRGELQWLRNHWVLASSVMSGAVESLRSGDHKRTDIHFLDVLSAFKGHERCTEHAWVHGVIDTPDELVPGRGSFHPTSDGYRAIAKRVQTWWAKRDWSSSG